MAEISTNIILDGITLALRKAYPESAIYCKAVKQGLRPPAFIALLATAGQEAQPSKRWKRSFSTFPRPAGRNAMQPPMNSARFLM